MSDLADLFARDPQSYTKEGGELAAIVAAMREKRGQFNLGNAKAGKVTAGKPSEKAAAVAGLNIGGLDL